MSKELTDAWKAGKLKCGYFFLKLINEHVTIGFYDSISFSCCCDFGIKEVISPCDYEIWAHLETKAEWQAERIKELEQDVKTLTNNYKLLEKQQAENLAHGQALVDEFGDFETLYEELQNLRSLLKECKDAYQIYIPLFKMLKNEEAVKTAVNLANKIGEVID